jgi:hypothetical protein
VQPKPVVGIFIGVLSAHDLPFRVQLLLLATFAVSCGGKTLVIDVDASSPKWPVADVDSQLTPDAPTSPATPIGLDSSDPFPDLLPSVGDSFVNLDWGGSCPGVIGTVAEIASTPRPYQGLELVAMNLDGYPIVASQSTYDRVLADVTAIASSVATVSRALNATPRYTSGYPGLTPPSGSMTGRGLILTVDAPTYASIGAGTYTAWDCLNSYYGVTVTSLQALTNANIVTVRSNGVLNTNAIAGLYQALPGIETAASNVVLSDYPSGSIQHICAGRSGGIYQYAFEFGSGDCESGCIDIDFICYESTAAGVVSPIPSGLDVGVDGGQDRCYGLYDQLCQGFKVGK